uniref:ATP synthase subunit a n=1 Tax=Ophiarachnella infernalis TaxID=2587522 RepID=A0A513X075_9ECHI|nr:ATP synthase F0 subunit 6 [Ophiarachnella infernalis]
MNLTLNNIFDQFLPSQFLFLPIIVIGGAIATSWLLLTNQSHWLTSRSSLHNHLLTALFYNLLESTNPPRSLWSHWIFSIFLLCLSFNLMSLIPYTFSQTSHLSITFSLSFPLWLTFQTTGALSNWKAKLSHLVPTGTPIYLIPVMILIETLSLFIQPLTLGFRLGANLLAGHLLIFLCSCVIWSLVNTYSLGLLSFILLFLLLILEIAVACIQAAVFLILSKNYLEENLQ